MDFDLLEAVLGRKVGDLSFTPGWLSGYVAETALGYSFPTLIEKQHGRVDGILTAGLTQADIERIAYFEDTEYEPVTVDIATARADVAAQVFMATTSLKSTGTLWSFETWRKSEKPLLLAVTHTVMAEHYGITPFEEVDAHWHRIKAELEAELHKPVALKRSRTAAQTPTAPRRATRAASPTRPRRRS